MPGINTSGHPFQCNELTIWARAQGIFINIIHACLSVDLHSFNSHSTISALAIMPSNPSIWNFET
jgi:hypothetical protein